jgi:hypothetical protein
LGHPTSGWEVTGDAAELADCYRAMDPALLRAMAANGYELLSGNTLFRFRFEG